MRIMLDTNILVSMIFFPSKQTQKLAQILTTRHTIVICDYVITELRVVVERKFATKKKYIERFFRELPFELVRLQKNDIPYNSQIRDIKDFPILMTIMNEDIDIFLTGDKDFFDINITHPRIMTMSDFLDMQ